MYLIEFRPNQPQECVALMHDAGSWRSQVQEEGKPFGLSQEFGEVVSFSVGQLESTQRNQLHHLVSLVIAVGCGDLPTETELHQPDLAIAGNSGCYAVSGALDQASVGPNLAGSISGDVVRSVTTVGGPAEIHGVVVFRPVSQTWEITGGIVGPLVGKTVQFENDFVGILAKLPVIRVNTTARVVDGAEKGI